jgi:hypothetical protein
MASIAEMAKEYVPAQTKNIAELDKVSTASQITEKVFKEGTDDEFKLNVINVDGEDYRVPSTVLATLKDILAVKPGLQFFKVTKSGSGLQTKYSVVPLD